MGSRAADPLRLDLPVLSTLAHPVLSARRRGFGVRAATTPDDGGAPASSR